MNGILECSAVNKLMEFITNGDCRELMATSSIHLIQMRVNEAIYPKSFHNHFSIFP
jgi:hypothetical protein